MNTILKQQKTNIEKQQQKIKTNRKRRIQKDIRPTITAGKCDFRTTRKVTAKWKTTATKIKENCKRIQKDIKPTRSGSKYDEKLGKLWQIEQQEHQWLR